MLDALILLAGLQSKMLPLVPEFLETKDTVKTFIDLSIPFTLQDLSIILQCWNSPLTLC